MLETTVLQPLLGKFPTPTNRDNISKNREFLGGNREFQPQNARKILGEDVPIAVELRRADVAGMNVTRPS